MVIARSNKTSRVLHQNTIFGWRLLSNSSKVGSCSKGNSFGTPFVSLSAMSSRPTPFPTTAFVAPMPLATIFGHRKLSISRRNILPRVLRVSGCLVRTVRTKMTNFATLVASSLREVLASPTRLGLKIFAEGFKFISKGLKCSRKNCSLECIW